jgi:hypothetical protein
MDSPVYRVLLDEQWSLEDLANFSRIYSQCYAFLYCLDTNSVDTASTLIESALHNLELRGGLSYVNVYDIFKSHVAKEHRPQVKSIQYASPGWIDLALNLEVATQFAKGMTEFLGYLAASAEIYKRLYKIYADLRIARRDLQSTTLKLNAEDATTAKKLNEELAKGLGFESLADLDKHTKDVEESSKLLMAQYRRMQKMAKFVNSGKASFPLND